MKRTLILDRAVARPYHPESAGAVKPENIKNRRRFGHEERPADLVNGGCETTK
jgi:hypothetical protein